VLSRKTYDIFAGIGPMFRQINPIAPAFTKANKYVLIRGLGETRLGQQPQDAQP